MKCAMALFCILFLAATASGQPGPDTLWTRIYPWEGSNASQDIVVADDGSLIVAAGDLIRFSSNGDSIWLRDLGFMESLDVKQISDGHIVAVGSAPYTGAIQTFRLVKLTLEGDTLWTRTYPPRSWDDRPSMVEETSDDGLVLCGWTFYEQATIYAWISYVIRTTADGDTLWTRYYPLANLSQEH